MRPEIDMTGKSLSRRQFMQIVAVGGIASLTAKFSLDALSLENIVTETRLLMGTVVNLKVVSPDRDAAQRAVWACFDQMEALERILSRFQPQSQLSRLNGDGQLTNASPHLLNLLAQSRQISEISGGAFDITIKPLVDLYQKHAAQGGLPKKVDVESVLELVDYQDIQITGNQVAFEKKDMAITLDGIAKGYIVDQGVETLKQNGFTDVLVEAGGDLLASGTKQQLKPWVVGVQSPRAEQHSKLMTHFKVQDQAVATSGDYMHSFSTDFGHHQILDPRTGFSAPGLASATIIAPTASLADSLATTVMVLGPQQGLDLLGQLSDCQGYLIDKNLRIFQSEQL
jgi:FAD:protein FMN transferase